MGTTISFGFFDLKPPLLSLPVRHRYCARLPRIVSPTRLRSANSPAIPSLPASTHWQSHHPLNRSKYLSRARKLQTRATCPRSRQPPTTQPCLLSPKFSASRTPSRRHYKSQAMRQTLERLQRVAIKQPLNRRYLYLHPYTRCQYVVRK